MQTLPWEADTGLQFLETALAVKYCFKVAEWLDSILKTISQKGIQLESQLLSHILTAQMEPDFRESLFVQNSC